MKKVDMDKKTLKKGALVAGGVALLAAFSAVCVKGLQAVDKKLKAKREVQEFDEETFEMAADAVEEEPVEEEIVAEEGVPEEPAVEESAAEEAAAEEPAEEKQPAE